MRCVGSSNFHTKFSQKAVEKWTEEHCPLYHSLYYDGGRGSSGNTAGFGGLIHTAWGTCMGVGCPLTKRSGFFW